MDAITKTTFLLCILKLSATVTVNVSPDEFNEMKQTIDFLKSAYFEEKTRSTDLEQKYEDLKQSYIEMSSELKETKTRLKQFENSVKTLPLKLKSASGGQRISNISPHSNSRQLRIAFYTWDVLKRYDLVYNQTIIFSRIGINEGSGYHPSTGNFLCSVPGTYVFYSNILSSPHAGVGTSIVKNGVDVAFMYSNDQTYYSPSSNMVIVHLNTGDRVWVRVSSRPPNGEDIGAINNSFSGFLLYQDI